jgi:pimeloyl-ACP methyl ester carboxylesterase
MLTTSMQSIGLDKLEQLWPQRSVKSGADNSVVYLVSGWSGPGIEWRFSPIRSLLRDSGYQVRYFRQKSNGWGDISDNACKLGFLIREHLDAGSKTYIIGHSMGGLVAKEAQRYGMPSAIVTIGTPHEGTHAARLAPWSTSAHQMRVGSDYIKYVNSSPSIAPMLCVACRYDEVVLPRESAIHNFADESLWVNHTHMTCIFSKLVAQHILDFLKSN